MVLEQTEAEIERPLPVGLTEFNAFAARIIAQAGAFADEDSMKFALATSIIHADASKGSLPDSFFINRLRKAAANQVASQVFQDIKAKQQAAQEAAKQQAEATPSTEVVVLNVEKTN